MASERKSGYYVVSKYESRFGNPGKSTTIRGGKDSPAMTKDAAEAYIQGLVVNEGKNAEDYHLEEIPEVEFVIDAEKNVYDATTGTIVRRGNERR